MVEMSRVLSRCVCLGLVVAVTTLGLSSAFAKLKAKAEVKAERTPDAGNPEGCPDSFAAYKKSMRKLTKHFKGCKREPECQADTKVQMGFLVR